MAASSKTTALKSILNVASTLTELLDSFSASVLPPVPQRPQPKSRPPPLALPRTRTLHLPLSRVSVPARVSQEFKSIYLAKVQQLRRVAQDEYNNLCRSLNGSDLANVAKLLRTSYRASEDYFAQQAIDACLDAHALATNSQPVQTSNQPKKPFDRTIVAIFEYIFDQPDGNFLDPVDKRRLADLSGMTDRQITVWFQNRRARTKQKMTAGKFTEPMTLDKAMVKLRADCEKARLAKIKATAFQTIVFKKTEKVLIDEAEEPVDEDTICIRDQLELDLRHQYATGALPNLDMIKPNPSSFPQPFVMPEYAEPRFTVPTWPRTSPKHTSEPIKPVTKQEVDDLAARLDDVVELRRTRTETSRRSVTFPLPLPAIVQEAVARRDAARIRDNKKPNSMAPQLHPADEANRVKIQALTSNAEELLKSNLKRDQVQIRGPQIISDRVIGHLNDQMTGMGLEHQAYVAPPLPPSIDTLATELSQADINKQHPESESSDTDQESGSEFWDDSVRPEAIEVPSLSSFLNAETDAQPDEMELPYDLVKAPETRINPADYPPILHTGLDCIPLDDTLMDSHSMNEALKMTLKQLHWKGPLPANIDEPLIFSHVPSLAAHPADARLILLEALSRGQEEEVRLLEDASLMDIGRDIMFDPSMIPDPTPPPASASEPFPYFAYSADTSVLPYQVNDLGDNSLPFALSDPTLQYGTWEGSALDQLYHQDHASLPFAVVNPAAQLSINVDTSAQPTFDQYFDPQGSALPFALMNQELPTYHTFTSAQPVNNVERPVPAVPETESFYDQQFSDPYMFFAPPPPEVLDLSTKTSAEPAISFYPSYLPQVPVITREVYKAARGVHRWLEKLTGTKIDSAPFIDAKEMLQYLA